MNFPYNNSNISTAPAYRVYISQLRRYVRAYSLYSGFLQRVRILSTKLLTQGSLENRYILSVKRFSCEISTPTMSTLNQNLIVNTCTIIRHLYAIDRMLSKTVLISHKKTF
jgi:hypothetical protein